MFLSKLPPTPAPSYETALSEREIEVQRLRLHSYFWTLMALRITTTTRGSCSRQ